MAAFVIAKSIGMATPPEGMLRRGESSPGEIHPKKVESNGHIPNDAGPVKTHLKNGIVPAPMAATAPVTDSILPVSLLDTLDLVCSMRGIEWEFGKGVYVAQETRPLQRGPFLRATLITFIKHYLLFDTAELVLKSFPGVGTLPGGSIFYDSLPPVQRYLLSTLLHFLTGWGLLLGFGMVYDLLTLFAVGALGQKPTSWPPVVDNPWIADSLHTFWSRRWHQLLRHIFLVFGGYPGHRLGGNLGMVLGTFLASGLYHECAMYGMGRGFDWMVPVFFLLQAPLLISERVFSRVFRRRVSGWWGTVWVYFCIGVLGQPLSKRDYRFLPPKS
jgi:hypothetical protein